MKKRILAHRGLHYETKFPKNSFEALSQAINEGYGIETDLRLHKGELAISHDSIETESCLLFDALLKLEKAKLLNSVFALNIKEDGLSNAITKFLTEQEEKWDYFVFDMSVPDSISFYKNQMNVYTRISEFEVPPPQFCNQSSGFWIDSFLGECPQLYWAQHALSSRKEFCLVSPELHGRDHLPLWEAIMSERLHQAESFRLCTDFPRQASDFFYSND